MRSKGLWRVVKLKPEEVRSSIAGFLAALVAPSNEGAIDDRTGSDGVSLAKCDSVPEEYASTLPYVEPAVLAEDYPEIAVVFPHATFPKAVTKLARY